MTTPVGEHRSGPAWSVEALARWLGKSLGIDSLTVDTIERLGGGAIQENWLLSVSHTGRAERWVLRTSAPRSLRVSHDRSEEFQLLRHAHAVGLTVPTPIIDCTDTTVIGKGFCVMQRCAGTAQARRLVRDADLPRWGSGVVQDVATNLARLHTLPCDAVHRALPFLDAPDADTPVNRRIAEQRRCLDEIPLPQPVLEYVLNWLQAHQPETQHWALLHGDCRTGNLLVHQGRLSALLDWEFAGFGEPREDLGWFSAPCWRFGNEDLGAGGLSDEGVLLDAYAAAGGVAVTATELTYWQILGELRWAVIALLQAERYYSGGECSLELALTDRLVPALEASMLRGIAMQEGIDADPVLMIDEAGATAPVALETSRLRQLLAAARHEVSSTLTPGLQGEQKYTAVLLRRALDVVEEELRGHGQRRRARLVDELVHVGLLESHDNWSSLAEELRRSKSVDDRFLSAFLMLHERH